MLWSGLDCLPEIFRDPFQNTSHYCGILYTSYREIQNLNQSGIFSTPGIIEKLSGGHIQGIIDISWNKETFSCTMQHVFRTQDAGRGACPVLFRSRKMKCRRLTQLPGNSGGTKKADGRGLSVHFPVLDARDLPPAYREVRYHSGLSPTSPMKQPGLWITLQPEMVVPSCFNPT